MKYRLLFIFSAVLLLSSCGAQKRLGYLQDMTTDVTYDMPLQPDAIIAKGDKLSISVYCSTPDLAAPFNLSTGMLSSGSSASAEAVGENNSYEVDKSGNIEFPILGKIHVEGRTLNYLSENIQNELISRRYMKDPVVKAEFSNFKYTLIGEISSGVHYVPDGKINIFEALAQAGEPNESALRTDVAVIRTVDGTRRMYTIDLTTKDCFYSPVFYLQQNDMVYLKPRKNKYDTRINDVKSTVQTIMQTVSSLLNTILWYTIYTR